MSPTPTIRPDIVTRERVRARKPSITTAGAEVTNPSTDRQPEVRSGSSADDRPVGYGNPPKHSQFKPGQSGNPKGRPKGARSLKVITRELMNQKVVVRSGGKVTAMKRINALALRMVEDAFAGKTRDRQMLLSLYEADVAERDMRQGTRGDEAPAPAIDRDAHDDAILAAMREMLIEELGKS